MRPAVITVVVVAILTLLISIANCSRSEPTPPLRVTSHSVAW